MKYISITLPFLAIISLSACVPMAKYKELKSNYSNCQEERKDYKSRTIDAESSLTELESERVQLLENIRKMEDDTLRLFNTLNQIRSEYDRLKLSAELTEDRYNELIKSGSEESARLVGDLEGTRVDLQRKEDDLRALEAQLNSRLEALEQKERRIADLEGIIREQEEAAEMLKEKISAALRGFKNKGISVEELDGKIYVRMEAKLLFASGSTAINPEGQLALIDLAQVLQENKEISIAVEGHTDSDQMKSSKHPKDNWELSVLRATSVVKLMLDNSNMDPTKITASGRSEFLPISLDVKPKNRRIEVIVTPDLNALFELISDEDSE